MLGAYAHPMTVVSGGKHMFSLGGVAPEILQPAWQYGIEVGRLGSAENFQRLQKGWVWSSRL